MKAEESHPLLTKAEFHQVLSGYDYAALQTSMLFNKIVRTYFPVGRQHYTRTAEDVVYKEQLPDGREEVLISVPNLARAIEERPLEEERTIGPFRAMAARLLIADILGKAA